MEVYRMSFWQLFLAGGPVMWPILICSVFALAIAMERFIFLNKISIDTQELLNRVIEKMKRHETKEAIAICDNAKNPITNILKAGILKYDRPRPQIIEAIEDASLYEVPRLQKNLNILSTIAHISPLLGLLGTAVGMVRCFQIIQARASAFQLVSPADLSVGTWSALITTVSGLIVAIPAYIVYNYLASRVNNFMLEMEKASTELVNFLTE
ncbi:MAG: MotA/TolQ/ExbB proton channel family protein [Candidatus Omnitrophica bacterium]|nr:MotA/TolQ/ExbB proton channel family protein [Candidatus Omnitrophota bacterium]